jgi:hypothetical protein
MVGKAEDHPPVGTNCDRPKAFQGTFEGVQPETGHIHVGHKPSRIESRRNVAQLVGVLGIDSTPVVRLVQAFQAFAQR